jgi:H+/Cl- antiporter ClcA
VDILLASGTGAGIAASFNAPLAGAIFAMEIILREFQPRVFSPIILASVTATMVGLGGAVAALTRGPLTLLGVVTARGVVTPSLPSPRRRFRAECGGTLAGAWYGADCLSACLPAHERGPMRWRLAFTCTLLLTAGTGCPDTWGIGGTMDQAMARDIAAEMHRRDCKLSEEEWEKKCLNPALWVARECPPECQGR